MRTGQGSKTYKSPQRKLVKFFEQSRNQWKRKCREAKAQIKRVKNRNRFLEKSRARWKEKAKELEAELAEVRAREKRKEKDREDRKKRGGQEREAGGESQERREVPLRHQYSVDQITMWIWLVLRAAASFRCASGALELFQERGTGQAAAPSWWSGRLWLLRLGYYKLAREKEAAPDWVWMVDHTVQVGPEKCLVIWGVRLSQIPEAGESLGHEDVEPLELIPVRKSNGEVVYQQLEEVVSKTGVPREIIGDQGSDLKAGVEKFCQAHEETSYVYDIKHKTAAVMKKELEKDPAWEEFRAKAAQSKKQLQQTGLAALAPPNQRNKSRYMNADVLIGWGGKMLRYLEGGEGNPDGSLDRKQVQEKLGWVADYREPLGQWQQVWEVISLTERFVREEGLWHGCEEKLAQGLGDVAQSERAQKVQEHLLTFVREESLKAKEQERLVGSSEVIESVFGKLKRLEQDQAKNGFTGLLLSVGAMVSRTTKEVVKKALETVKTKEVLHWAKETLGPTVQAKRREALGCTKKTEQKWDQLHAPT